MAINRQRWIGVACGVCCALCVALYMASVRGEVDAARAEALERYGGDQVEVCVAKRDLAAGETVDSAAIVQKLWVADLLPDGAVSDPTQIVGKRLGSSIIEGEVICAQRTELADSALSVPAGKAAISVPARAVQAVGGSIEAGMEVDVYATGPVSTTKLVGGALVLASSASGEGSSGSEWVTLAVDPERVQEVVAAAQNLELYFVLPAEGASEVPAGEGSDGAAAPSEAEQVAPALAEEPEPQAAQAPEATPAPTAAAPGEEVAS
ncbi:Flp pilus assembly protein CpaB [uncultured Adlercreutzia sp.]|uniref:Flp pilus assembly protein CpaB n=1 Tax=uncultured Adlercreutzia sp. TaxID=875803 RepID=UPI0026F3C192|nr:Flp pilus assembly protein CpaB [uncultured Adlercreutzia sp.]